MTEFGTLYEDGSYESKGTVEQSSMLQCPHCIMVFEHYREDNSCRCDDPEHIEMAEWEYSWNGERWE
jgi:hypothetical protein